MPSVYHISLFGLTLSIGLTIIVAVIFWRWSLSARSVFYATLRMIGQLIAIGFVLTFIFEQKNPAVIVLFLLFMWVAASWIALRPLGRQRRAAYPRAFLAIGVGGILTLLVIIGGVIDLSPWYEPRYLIPIAGMIFANSMNGLSLAAERFQSEYQRGESYQAARGTALQTALLPLTNSFLAVGLVALPGMMTGQILAGVDPLTAVRYQIMVMCMVFASAGISASIYLGLMKKPCHDKNSS